MRFDPDKTDSDYAPGYASATATTWRFTVFWLFVGPDRINFHSIDVVNFSPLDAATPTITVIVAGVEIVYPAYSPEGLAVAWLYGDPSRLNSLVERWTPRGGVHLVSEWEVARDVPLADRQPVGPRLADPG